MRAAPLALLLLVACGPGRMPASIEHALAGSSAPEFESDTTTARSVSVPSHSPRTKVIVVDFWASWCAECLRSMPALQELWRDKKEDGLLVIAVSVDEVEQDTIATAERYGASFPVVFDPHMRVAAPYGVAAIPLTFVIDRGGRIRWVGRDMDGARRAVNVVLAE